MTIVPIHEVQRRIREQGRIRLGDKTKAGYPRKLKRFRFTSNDRPALEAIAKLYGGTVTPWDAAPTADQHQVTITAMKVAVLLPPQPLGDFGPVYELWSGGGNQRRCDGELCTIPGAQEPVPCMCLAKGAISCKPTLRLSVVLRDVDFGGVWRLESHGWNTFKEIPGMVDLIEQLQGRGLNRAQLGVEERESREEGQPVRKFVVPTLTLDDNLEALAAGALTVGALGRAPVPDLMALDPAPVLGEEDDDEAEAQAVAALDHAGMLGEPGATWVEDPNTGNGDFVDAEGRSLTGSDDIEDAEIVDEGPAHGAAEAHDRARRRALHAGIRQAATLSQGLADDDFRHALVRSVTRGATSSSNDLDDEQLTTALDIVDDLLDGSRGLLKPNLTDDGRLRVSRKRGT